MSSNIEVFVKKDVECARKCSLCKSLFKGKRGKYHFGYACTKCITRGYICCDCMSKEIVQIKLCDGLSAYYALEGEKILCFDEAEVKVMIKHGDVTFKERESGGTALAYTQRY